MKIVLYTAFALTAFALNSILCRLALGSGEADAAGFTALRLISGAITLAFLASLFSKTKNPCKSGHWAPAIFLFIYAICFSFAYLGLTAGTGALILFGSVQMTIIGIAVFSGAKLSALEWLGLAAASSGLVYLVYPGLASPPLHSSLLMAFAGGAWGLYTLRGIGSSDPLADTAGNFIRTLPFAAIAAVAFLPGLQLSTRGVLLAVLSGSIASGVGYTVWYAALRHHTSVRAAVLQLAVPVLTALLGMAFLDERATMRLVIGGAMILGGIAMTAIKKK